MADPAIDEAGLEAARLLLQRTGISPLDLVAGVAARPAPPTFADYVPVIAASTSASLLRAYGTYWDRFVERWGTRRIDEVTPSEIRALITALLGRLADDLHACARVFASPVDQPASEALSGEHVQDRRA
ncbi:hypothetical protein ACQP2F_18025 [Actinoplanes sp. CA-030573]|uniref:hypothetical protein n=1 Tax=Actinoplanes sp. CA-030573 TaxID=3239898 RepID=UPI003D8BD5DB